MSVPKRHHAVPQFYLKGFAQADGLHWLHDLRELRATRVSPNNAIVERFLYSPGHGEDPDDPGLELLLAKHVDGPAAQSLERLASGEGFTDDDRHQVAQFLAFQEFRTTRMRDLATGIASELGERVLRLAVENPDHVKQTLADAGRPISDEMLAKLTRAVQSGGVKVEATKTAWFAMISNMTKVASMIHRMPWTIASAPEGFEFLTSDTPVVKILTDRSVPAHYSGGWLSPSAETTFALNPS